MIKDLLHEHAAAVWWITIISALFFVGSLMLVPWLVVRIPEDYFVGRRRPKSEFATRHPVLRWTLWAGRNMVAVILVVAGVVMLVLPGQGLLTIAMGLILGDYPGKRRLERRLIRLPAVRKPINWLRQRRNQPPLRLDEGPNSASNVE